eukprot:jgi/Mesvir1/22353/Mv26158-RA.1
MADTQPLVGKSALDATFPPHSKRLPMDTIGPHSPTHIIRQHMPTKKVPMSYNPNGIEVG